MILPYVRHSGEPHPLTPEWPGVGLWDNFGSRRNFLENLFSLIFNINWLIFLWSTHPFPNFGEFLWKVLVKCNLGFPLIHDLECAGIKEEDAGRVLYRDWPEKVLIISIKFWGNPRSKRNMPLSNIILSIDYWIVTPAVYIGITGHAYRGCPLVLYRWEPVVERLPLRQL